MISIRSALRSEGGQSSTTLKCLERSGWRQVGGIRSVASSYFSTLAFWVSLTVSHAHNADEDGDDGDRDSCVSEYGAPEEGELKKWKPPTLKNLLISKLRGFDHKATDCYVTCLYARCTTAVKLSMKGHELLGGGLSPLFSSNCCRFSRRFYRNTSVLLWNRYHLCVSWQYGEGTHQETTAR